MIAEDKRLHLVAGLGAALFSILAYALLALVLLGLTGVGLPTVSLIPVPFLGALVAGAVKEAADLLDSRQYAADLRHTVDPWDVVATALPGLILSVIVAGATL